MTSRKVVALTTKEWDALDRKSNDSKVSALPPCCANISTLRDTIAKIRENNGVITEALDADLAMHWEWCVGGHDFDDKAHPTFRPLRSLIEQAGLTWPVPA